MEQMTDFAALVEQNSVEALAYCDAAKFFTTITVSCWQPNTATASCCRKSNNIRQENL